MAKAQLKKGDKLDFAPTLAQQKVLEAATAKQFIQDVEEMQAQPDIPKRWGSDRGKLTILSPGNIVEDATYIPEYVRTFDGRERCVSRHRVINGNLHVLTPSADKKYRWCLNDPQKFSLHKRRGWDTSRYSWLFADTGMFKAGLGDTVENGDLVLMEISLDGWDRICAEKRRLQALLESDDAQGSELFAEGNRYGVPTFRDDIGRGVREFYS
jgi:hypothetical protein